MHSGRVQPFFVEKVTDVLRMKFWSNAYAVPETAGTDGKERENYVYHNGEIQ